jgi:hypothetical protein
MTEAEWLSGIDLFPMLVHLRGEVEPSPEEFDVRGEIYRPGVGILVSGEGIGDYKERFRDFAQESTKNFWGIDLDDVSKGLVNCYERFLSDKGSWGEVEECFSRITDVAESGRRPTISTASTDWTLTPFGIANLTTDLVQTIAHFRHRKQIEERELAATEEDYERNFLYAYDFPELRETAAQLERTFPVLLRDIFGNPFRPVTLDPRWLTSSVLDLARVIYDERAFERMPVLADALMDAGCDNDHILVHCRGDSPHVRGCWVVDLLLGKE